MYLIILNQIANDCIGMYWSNGTLPIIEFDFIIFNKMLMCRWTTGANFTVKLPWPTDKISTPIGHWSVIIVFLYLDRSDELFGSDDENTGVSNGNNCQSSTTPVEKVQANSINKRAKMKKKRKSENQNENTVTTETRRRRSVNI